MNARFRAYLELVRLPNLFSAAADVLAGYLYASGGGSAGPGLWLSIGSSVAFYAGGMALNDVCDASRDAVERANRPIPSGRISRRAALRLALLLLSLGVVGAFTVSARTGLVGAGLTVAIVLYSLWAKHGVLGPVVMGLCRAANLGLGMSAAADVEFAHVFLPTALMWLYIASVTFFARDEAGTSSHFRLRLGTSGVWLAALGLTLLPAVRASDRREAGFVAVGLAVMLAWIGLRAVRRPSPGAVQHAVRLFLISLIAFDAVLAWIGGGGMAGAAVATLAIPMILLSRAFRVT